MADIDQDFEHKRRKGKKLYDMTSILYYRYHRIQKECKENEHYTHKGGEETTLCGRFGSIETEILINSHLYLVLLIKFTHLRGAGRDK